ncbi:purine operon repressor [Symbiobacterium terraclitae]|uniref:Purine operon repressor n=1 Tax=Symbiobacterium terraclitae TaxID=557451 RepID=A0ABS4JY65_9FIRM|nr:purine operon repressor [Symbiobacterium terraclitae]
MNIDRMNRSQRLVAIMKLLSERPGELLPLSLFTERFGTAKSTISEDLALVKEALEADGSGRLRTLPGAAGGVQYWPLPSREEEQETLLELCRLLSDPGRILPGGFVYMTDLLTHPIWSARIGAIMAARFIDAEPDVVLTVETKGIPLALMVARALGLPMVMARREGRVTEGPSVTLHYISGSSRRIHTMTVGLRALRRGSRVLIVDDFMKAGTTARAMVDVAGEMGASVAGVGIFVTTAQPARKQVDQYVSLLTLEHVDEEERAVHVVPSERPPKE